MNASSADAWQELDRLIDGACDQTLSTAEMKALSGWLISDPQACDRYIAHMAVHRQLAWRLMPAKPFSPDELDRYTQADLDMLDAESAPLLGAPMSVLPIPTQFGQTHSGLFGYVASGWPVAYLIATVILGIGLVVGAIVHVSQPMNVVQKPASLRLPLSPLHSAVARITGMVDCVWESSGRSYLPSPAGTDRTLVGGRHEVVGARGEGGGRSDSPLSTLHSPLVSLGDRLALRSGLLEIAYDTGARVILQGPVTYEVDSAVGGYLAVGKLTAKLEKGLPSPAGTDRRLVGGHNEVVGVGWEDGPNSLSANNSQLPIQKSKIINQKFVIRTPTAVVTDLGTEFGVEVSQEGRTEAQVFIGTIQIAPAGGRSGSAKEQVVHAGSTVRWDDANNHVTVIEPSERRFVRMLPALEPTGYSSADDYGKLVLSLRPVAYYRMEPSTNPKDRTVVVDSASGGHHGTLASTHELADPWTLGRYGRSLRFNGLHYVVVRDVPGATARQLSVSAWVYARFVRDWSTIATEHYVDASNPQLWNESDAWQFNFSIQDVGGDLCVAVNQSNRVGVSLREGAAKPLPTGQWQHVAFVADGSSLRLYRNGIEVASTPCDGVCVVPSIKCLTIGCKGTNRSWTDSDPSPNYFWRGNIDELAIFNHGLSAAEIRQLCEGRPRESKATASEATQKP